MLIAIASNIVFVLLPTYKLVTLEVTDVTEQSRQLDSLHSLSRVLFALIVIFSVSFGVSLMMGKLAADKEKNGKLQK